MMMMETMLLMSFRGKQKKIRFSSNAPVASVPNSQSISFAREKKRQEEKKGKCQPAVSVNDKSCYPRGGLRSQESRVRRDDGARCMSLGIGRQECKKMLQCHRMGRQAAAARRGGDPIDNMNGTLGGNTLCRSWKTMTMRRARGILM